MDWNDAIDLRSRKFTTQLIIQRAMARGWDVAGFKTSKAIILVQIPDRPEPIFLFSASPPQISYPASKVAKDKHICTLLLERAGLPVPRELLYDRKKGLEPKIEAFLSETDKAVLKPLDGAHGNGITVNIQNAQDLERGITEAEQHTKLQYLLLQEQLPGVDVRIVCIDYKFVDSMIRLPAAVVGDGIHSVAELVATTNNHEDRGENYKTRLNRIPMVQVERYLSAAEFVRIPAEGEEVQVVGTANVGTGGVRINSSDLIPDWLKTMAEAAAKTLQLPVCGMDFIVAERPTKDSTPEALRPQIIEANACPSLTMHDDLHSPEQYATIDHYLDYVASC